MFETNTLALASRNRVANLSLQGLLHAQTFAAEPVTLQAARLYNWNRLPAAAWRRACAEPARVAALSIPAAGRNWTQAAPGPPISPWCVWRPRHDPRQPNGRVWKLYVSPAPLHLAEAVAAALRAAADLPVISLKYGGDANGLLRPDKLVIHLASAAAVDLLASRLLASLAGCPPHGVPFTAELGGGGLVSWGCDPPAGSTAAAIAPSWRSWLTHLLAESLAQPHPAAAEPWQAALSRIAQAGVNPATWAPSRRLWAAARPNLTGEPS